MEDVTAATCFALSDPYEFGKDVGLGVRWDGSVPQELCRAMTLNGLICFLGADSSVVTQLISNQVESFGGCLLL